jgi:DNA gyrase subunit A
MFTVRGQVKRVSLSEFEAVRASGLVAIALDQDDALGWALITDGSKEIIVTTQSGKTLRFAEETIRARGRAATGIAGIRLAEDDTVACVDVIEPGGELLVATQNGFAKRTALDEYPAQGRNTMGVTALHARYLDLTGPVVSALVVQPQDTVTLITAEGMALHTAVEDIPQSGRSTRGQIVINIYKGDRLSAVARQVINKE